MRCTLFLEHVLFILLTVLKSHLLMFSYFHSVLALEASLGGVAGGGLGAESTFDRNNLGQVCAAIIIGIKSPGYHWLTKLYRW